MFDFEENVWYVLSQPKKLAKEPFCELLSNRIMSFGGKIKPMKCLNGSCHGLVYSNGLPDKWELIPQHLSVYFKKIGPSADSVAIEHVPNFPKHTGTANIIQFPKNIQQNNLMIAA